MKKVVVLLLALLFSGLVAIPSAEAVCSQYGNVIRVNTVVTGVDTQYAYIYFRPFPMANYIYYAYTYNPIAIAFAQQALSTQNRVFITANISVCPTVATGGVYNLGMITSYYLNP